MHTLNHTHDPAARSWLAEANGHPEFPIQNLPFAEFSHGSDKNALRGGVAIGDQIIDLAALSASGLLQGVAGAHCQVAAQDTLNAFMFLGPDAWRSLRHALFALLQDSASAQQQAALRAVTYANTSENPNLATRTVTFVVNDGDVDSSPLTSTVSLTATNDAPTLTTAGSASFTENGSAVAIAAVRAAQILGAH